MPSADSMTPAPDIATLIALLGAGPWVVLTGAGLSTGSGIPAYRDRHGQWLHSKPIQHQEFLSLPAMRRRYWARSFVGWQTLSRAAPNAGHRAIAQLEARGLVSTVITQNVDSLHHHAGSQAVIELHGSIARVLCLSCQGRYPRAQVQTWLAAHNPHFEPMPPAAFQAAPDGDAHLEDQHCANFQVPTCPACQGVLKPDVVFFGDNVPRERVAAASQAVENASALLVIGSSLSVYSGFRFAEQAHRLGKPVVAINQGATRADPLLSAKLELDCSDALALLLNTVLDAGQARVP
ncbi:NAD-dependent protein deacetylase [Aquabacterium sp.]|uniref:NAD-dependent protein deacetylase n=1 Tax=Aquabacterium sp. TaxID=1872578 RepID=UPI0019B5785C|nr:NAD-dependent protein deacetylase [Aquabacterium sp.]MBC7700233.1 NAD-dependent protein deacetylase [Aquabacterium sp.]